MLSVLASALIAAAPVRVSVNERPLEVTAIVRDGRVLVPLRGIFSALDAVVRYRAAGHTITAHRRSTTVELRVGRRDATLNGFPVKLDATPQIVAGRVFVPVRFVAQALGARVMYDPSVRTVFVRDQQPALAVAATPTAVTQDTPAPSYPTSAPVPSVAPQPYPAYPTNEGFGFNLYLPSPERGNIFFPGDRVRLVLVAPPGGTAFLRVCGLGDLPFVNPPGTTQYFASFIVPGRLRNRDCNAIAYYTGALGARQTIALPQRIYFAAPTPTPTPTPRPTATPAPALRTTEPVFRRSPPPGSPGKPGA